ncbi:MAG TPA: pyridoxal-phosphate dependent enzyme [Solirubrobacteraceae bacterium]|nr:pyridoxal-phosphate dependent enzyme [Solirubrobacteraceae bacterium]
MPDPFAALRDRPRVALATLPTPLERAPRLSAELGVEIWLKRDDVGSLGLMGNKVRKLEFTLGEALARGAVTVVTLGAPQSNHARATACAAAKVGLHAVLVMGGEQPAGPPTGNLLLDALFGAELLYAGTDDWAQLAATVEAATEDRANAYALPAGGSSPVGALGFAAAYAELLGQLSSEDVRPQRVYHASTSGGTHAGLMLGHALAGGGPAAFGFDVGRIVPDGPALTAWLANEAGALLGADVTLTEHDAHLDLSQLGDGYGAFTDAGIEAIDLLARTEGVALDPVYSAKGMAGLIADARAGHIDGPVVFWHTGGGPSLFAAGWGERLLPGA